jgi:periplasmic divalent cation tolerance protein
MQHLKADVAEAVCEVVVTAPDPAWLAKVTRQLLERRLVASSHQIDAVRSIYRWEGEVHERREARVSLRTRAVLFDQVSSFIRTAHPYVTPSIVALPITQVTEDYLQWLLRETLDGN